MSRPRPVTPTVFTTVQDVANSLYTTDRKVIDMIYTGELPGFKIGNQYRIPVAAVAEYLKRAQV